MDTTSPSHADAFIKAGTLTEALPWIRRFQGSIFVIKLGGNAMVDDALLQAFADDMVFLATVGVKPIVVHGGGPQISRALDDRGIPSEFQGGYRVTSTEAIPIIRDVLRDHISADIRDRINSHSDLAVVLSGRTMDSFPPSGGGPSLRASMLTWAMSARLFTSIPVQF